MSITNEEKHKFIIQAIPNWHHKIYSRENVSEAKRLIIPDEQPQPVEPSWRAGRHLGFKNDVKKPEMFDFA